ncbi:MAG: winged helix-turn-helix transcriptional regulator, partial [Lachnospiraceae bacterium]|nr:winged helix-turn-helix transcriptional regulator [Lachnospiraceae bacterium]
IYKEMKKAGLPEPEYRDVAFMLHATIRNGANVADNVVNDVVDNVVDKSAPFIKLSATEQAVLEYLQGVPTLSAKELAILLRKTPRTIQRNITTLKEKGYLRREGSARNGKWIILKEE